MISIVSSCAAAQPNRSARRMSRPSPLQNRVAPDGSLHAVTARGTLMGNRGGRLHDDAGRLGRARWRSRAWIACEIAFRGRRRTVMGAGYTELFFLDEATALAAGHRPCFECRRAEARAFAAAWARATGAATPPRAAEMDAVLHDQRLGAQALPLADIVPGAMVAWRGGYWLRREGGLCRWDFAGYGAARRVSERELVGLVTPPAICAVLAAGYRPRLHPSLRA
jgi:hypothetical protein